MVSGLAARLEVSQLQFSTSDNSNARNVLSLVIDSLAGLDGVDDMRVVVGVTRNGETDKVQNALSLLLSLLIVLEGEGTKLAGSDTVLTEKFNGETDTTTDSSHSTDSNIREGSLVHVGNTLEELGHIQVDGVTTGRKNDRKTLLSHHSSHLTDLVDTGAEIGLLADLVHTHSSSHDISAGETTVGVVSVLENLALLDSDTDIETGIRELLVEDALISKHHEASQETYLKARIPPMLTRPSFLRDMVKPSQWEKVSLRISWMDLSCQPSSNSLMK